ncbi:MAG: hypothetical protein ACOYM7_05850 [Paludibacter sp.]|jgi:hypothetical protein
MKQLTVYINDTSYSHFMELVKHLSYVKKVESYDETSKLQVVESIKVGLKEVSQFKKGNLKTTTSKQFLNELQHTAN